jgi:hypothetical protein
MTKVKVCAGKNFTAAKENQKEKVFLYFSLLFIFICATNLCLRRFARRVVTMDSYKKGLSKEGEGLNDKKHVWELLD